MTQSKVDRKEVLSFLSERVDQLVTVEYRWHQYLEELTGTVVGVSERMHAGKGATYDAIIRGRYGKLRTVAISRITGVREGR
jgi:hypothetical protein